jgi:hypothetical protein
MDLTVMLRKAECGMTMYELPDRELARQVYRDLVDLVIDHDLPFSINIDGRLIQVQHDA